MLSTPQLRLAYAALVKGACCDAESAEVGGEGVLGWYCMSLLLDAARPLSSSDIEGAREQRHKLHLTLISCLASLPLGLLTRALEEVRLILETAPRVERDDRKELVAALHVAIRDEIGDMQKPYAMRWWYDNREKFGLEMESDAKMGMKNGEVILQTESPVSSRL
jgi:hypothetical protein